MKGSSMSGGGRRDGLGGALQRGGGAGVGEVDAHEHLGEVQVAGDHGVHVVGGVPVVHLEARAAQAAAVHRADDDLLVEQAEQGEVVDHVGGREHAVDAGAAERDREALEQVVAVGHGRRVGADREGSTRGVVGGDDEETVAERAAPTGGEGARDGLRGGGADAGEVDHRSSASTSAAVGIAVEHSRREATMAPATFA